MQVREMPQSAEAEVCVLGSMLLDPDTIPEAREIVGVDDFYRPAHRTIFDALCKMHQAGSAIDLVIFQNYLTDNGQLEKVGGIEYVDDIVSGVPSAANLKYYAGIVREKSALRQLIGIGTKLADRAYHPEGSAEGLIDETQQRLIEQDARHKRMAGNVADAGEISGAVLKRTEEVWRNPDCFVGLKTGISILDKATGGLRPGNYAVLAGVTGKGKTTLATSITESVCRQGKAVLYISAEMTPAELMERMLAAKSDIYLSRIRNGRLRDGDVNNDWGRLADADAKIAQWKLRIIGKPLSVPEIAAAVRKFGQDLHRPVDLVVIDYLQKMKGPGNSRYEQVSGVSGNLKNMALDLGVPLLVLAQLRREVGQSGRKPCLHDLKETGETENDADVVLLLHHPPDNGPDVFDQDQYEVWLKIDKNRNGPETPWPSETENQKGAIRLKWKPSVTRFSWPVE